MKRLSPFMAVLFALSLAACSTPFHQDLFEKAATKLPIPSSGKAITAFGFASPAATGQIDENAKTIAVTVPFGTSRAALAATFATTGTTVTVGGVAQVTGATPHDFSLPVAYVVGAADGSAATYTVTVSVAPSSAKQLTVFGFASPAATGQIDESAKTIAVTVPFGTSRAALVATFTATGTTVTVGGVAQVTGATPHDFSLPVAYVVGAADGSAATYTVTVKVALNPAKTITSFAFAGLTPSVSGTIDQAAHTIAVTVPFATNVTSLVPTIAITGASVSPASGIARNFSSPVTYAVTAADGTTQAYAVMVTVAPNPAKDITSFAFTTALNGGFGVSVDCPATIAGIAIGVTLPYGATTGFLKATYATTGASVKVGATIQMSGNTQNDFSTPVIYTVTAADGTTKAYTVTVTVAPNPAKTITSFAFAGLTPSVSGTIDQAARTIALTVPFATNVTNLVPTIGITGAGVSPASGIAQNFSGQANYTVTAADGSSAIYKVTVSVALSSAKQITAFGFGLASETDSIDETAKAITVSLPLMSVSGLVATFTASSGATVKINSVLQVSGTTANDFSTPVVYAVTAPDGSVAVYTVGISMPNLQVVYSANGGSGSPPVDASYYASGASVTVLDGASSLSNSTYLFGGWNTSQTGGAATTGSDTYYSPGQNLTITQPTVLYAVWLDLSNPSLALPPSLTSVVIPAGVTTVPTSLKNNASITSITWLGTGAIPASAFQHDSALTSISMPNATTVGDQAFLGCTSLANVALPASVTAIGSSAFSGCSSLTQISLPGVTTINGSAFNFCTSLTDSGISMPSVTYIGSGAFSHCDALTSVTIPASCTQLMQAFDNNSSLTTIHNNSSSFSVVHVNNADVIYDLAQTTLIQVSGGMAGDFVIPSTVSYIDAYAFGGCSSLTGVSFAGNPASINGNAFSGLRSKIVITIPSSVNAISQTAMNYSDIIGVIIPSSVTSIGASAFSGCSYLVSVTMLGASPPSLPAGSNAFKNADPGLQIHVPSGSESAYRNAWSDYAGIITSP